MYQMGKKFCQSKKRLPYCDWLPYKGMHIWVFRVSMDLHINNSPPVDLHLIFEKWNSKNGFAPFLVYFELDFTACVACKNQVWTRPKIFRIPFFKHQMQINKVCHKCKVMWHKTCHIVSIFGLQKLIWLFGNIYQTFTE